MKVKRYKGSIVPMTTEVVNIDGKEATVISYGQHDNQKRLHGLGIRMRIWAEKGIDIWEGQYKRDELHGIARWISLQWAGDFDIYFGGWKDSCMDGQGKLI